jgi:hypothetical protein
MHHTTQRLYTLITCPNFYVGIGTSTIHGAQRGLFTTKERDDQDYLCPYLGDLQKDAPNSSIGEYSFYSPGRNETVHGNPSTSYGPYANDPMDETKANCKITWRASHRQYWLRALGPIANRTELLTMYGHEFWERRRSLSPDTIRRAYPIHLRRPQSSTHAGQC